jgi:hypothetical protein
MIKSNYTYSDYISERTKDISYAEYIAERIMDISYIDYIAERIMDISYADYISSIGMRYRHYKLAGILDKINNTK